MHIRTEYALRLRKLLRNGLTAHGYLDLFRSVHRHRLIDCLKLSSYKFVNYFLLQGVVFMKMQVFRLGSAPALIVVAIAVGLTVPPVVNAASVSMGSNEQMSSLLTQLRTPFTFVFPTPKPLPTMPAMPTITPWQQWFNTPTMTPRTAVTPTLTPIRTPTPTSNPSVIVPSPTRTPSPTLTNTSTPTQTPMPTRAVTTTVQQYLLDRVNAYRVSQGLGAVAMDPYTWAFAATRAREISTSFNHNGFSQRVNSRSLPYPGYSYVTENIAMTSDYRRVVDLWINSAGHARNMRANTPYVCVAQYGNYYAYEGWRP